MMKEKEVVLTKEGLAGLEAELESLKTVRRREVADRIKQASSSAISVKTPSTRMRK